MCMVSLRTSYRLSLVIRLSLICSKFMFSGIQLFGLKATLHGKPYLKKDSNGR